MADTSVLDGVSVDDIPAPQSNTEESHLSDIHVDDIPPPAQLDLTPEFVKNKLQMSEPWQKGTEFQGYNLDLTDPKIKAQYDSIKAIETVPNPIMEGLKMTGDAAVTGGKTLLDLIQIPVHAGSGLYARLSNLGGPYEDGKSIASQAWDKFANPPEIQSLRQKFDYDPNTAYGLITGFNQEVAPELLPSQVISDVTKDKILGGIADAFLPPGTKDYVTDKMGKAVDVAIGESGKKAVKNLAFDVGLDPAMWVEVFPAFSKAANIAAREGDLASSLKMQGEVGMRPSGLAAQAEQGQRAMLAVKVPFTDATLFKYKGLKTLQQIDDFTSYANSVLQRTPFRVLSQRTPYEMFNQASTSLGVRNAADNVEAANLLDTIKAQGLNNERVQRLARDMREFGSEQKAMIKGQSMGMNYSYEEMEKAGKLNDLVHEWVDNSNAKWNSATGDNVSRHDFIAPTPEEQAKYIKDMEHRGFPVSKIIIDGEDYTFSRAYDGGRSLSDEMLSTPQGRRARNVFEYANKNSKFSVNPSSLEERNALSTDAMNMAYNELGFKEGEAFNPNSIETIVNKGLEKRKAANNLDFVDFATKNYGVKSPFEAEAAIREAGLRVEQAKLNGISPTTEDLILSKSKSSDFVLPSPDVARKLRGIYGEQNVKSIAAGDTYYPRDIARHFENLIAYEPSKSQVAQGLATLQKTMAKNVLTSIKRVPRQLVDNTSRMMALRAFPELVGEMGLAAFRSAQGMTAKLIGKEWGPAASTLEKEANALPQITETAWDLGDFRGPVKANAAMVRDPEVRDSYYQWLEKLNDSVKFNRQNEALGFVKDNMGKWAKSALHPTDNVISSYIRQLGSGSDNLARRALYKKYRSDGYGINDAVALVQRGLMDFQNTDKALKGFRYVSPFASFHLKNLESLPTLLASQPGMANVIRPDENGYLYKHVMDWRGWDPADSRLLEKINPINHHPLYFGLMKGKDELIANPSVFDKYLNKYLEAGLTPDQVGKMQGNAVTFDVPTYLEATFGFADFKNTLSSPFTKAIIALNGDSPFNGQPMKNYGLGIKNIYSAMSEVNPYNYPKFYNEVVMPEVAKFKPDIVRALHDGPLGPAVSDVLKVKFGDGPLSKINIDEDTIKTMTSDKFLGLANMDLLDRNYVLYQRALMKAQTEIVGNYGGSGKLMEAAVNSGKNREVLAVLKHLMNISQDIQDNTKLYFALRAKKPKTMAPDELESVQMEFDPDAKDKEPVPETPDPPQDSDFEDDDSAFNVPQASRMPAAQTPTVFDRSSQAYGNHPELAQEGIRSKVQDQLEHGGIDQSMIAPPDNSNMTLPDKKISDRNPASDEISHVSISPDGTVSIEGAYAPHSSIWTDYVKKEMEDYQVKTLSPKMRENVLKGIQKEMQREIRPNIPVAGGPQGRSPAGGLVEENGQRASYEEPGPMRQDQSQFQDYDLFKDNPEMRDFWNSLPDDKKQDALKIWMQHLSSMKKVKK